MNEDFTVRVSELHMYSFERPAYIFWNAVMNGLMEQGATQHEAEEWLKSKATRWALDGQLGADIDRLGRAFATTEALKIIPLEEVRGWSKKARA